MQTFRQMCLLCVWYILLPFSPSLPLSHFTVDPGNVANRQNWKFRLNCDSSSFARRWVAVTAGAAWPSSESDAVILPHLSQDVPTEEGTPDHCGCAGFDNCGRRGFHIKPRFGATDIDSLIVNCDDRPQPFKIFKYPSFLLRNLVLFRQSLWWT
jgi:hypothetical protein